MKNIFSLALALTVTLGAFAQAPQGFNYQAVVLNSSGAALSNQTVSLQLSILDSSASGVAVYVETQNPTTDTIGLFSVVIGNGTVVTGNFSAINWGKNYKFLKTEIDTAGGTNYVLMGISQMMSVPYALYANKAQTSYGSINIPDGMDKITPVLLDSFNYTVPIGKNLYVPALHYYRHGTDTISGWTGTNPYIGFGEGETISLLGSASNFSIFYGITQGFLVDKIVDWITTDIILNPITVPLGKIFIVSIPTSNPYGFYNPNGGGYDTPNVFLDGQQIDPYSQFNLVLFPGQTLSGQLTGVNGQFLINGYFRDE